MTLTITTMTLTMSLLVILMASLSMMTKKSINRREKQSPFECGFDPKSSARIPFSLHFFLISVIFLIFDVEITLIYPIMMLLKMNKTLNLSIIISLFLTILLTGLYHEWKQGTLNWTN